MTAARIVLGLALILVAAVVIAPSLADRTRWFLLLLAFIAAIAAALHGRP